MLPISPFALIYAGNVHPKDLGLVILGIGAKLAAVMLPAALPLASRSTADKLVGMIMGKRNELLAVVTVAIAHQAAPDRDACRPL